MPRYFFDIYDGNGDAVDDVGLELSDEHAAKQRAIAVLPDIARDLFPDGDNQDVSSIVRDAFGNVLVRATLTLSVENISTTLKMIGRGPGGPALQ